MCLNQPCELQIPHSVDQKTGPCLQVPPWLFQESYTAMQSNGPCPQVISWTNPTPRRPQFSGRSSKCFYLISTRPTSQADQIGSNPPPFSLIAAVTSYSASLAIKENSQRLSPRRTHRPLPPTQWQISSSLTTPTNLAISLFPKARHKRVMSLHSCNFLSPR